MPEVKFESETARSLRVAREWNAHSRTVGPAGRFRYRGRNYVSAEVLALPHLDRRRRYFAREAPDGGVFLTHPDFPGREFAAFPVEAHWTELGPDIAAQCNRLAGRLASSRGIASPEGYDFRAGARARDQSFFAMALTAYEFFLEERLA